MPKLKTRRTLTKRIRITKNGKVLKKQNRLGHLKRKMDASRKSRKNKTAMQPNEVQAKTLRRLLGK